MDVTVEAKFDGDLFVRWWNVGKENGLSSHAEIARCLVDQYENNPRKDQRNPCCDQCQSFLVCAKCPMPSVQNQKAEKGCAEAAQDKRETAPLSVMTITSVSNTKPVVDVKPALLCKPDQSTCTSSAYPTQHQRLNDESVIGNGDADDSCDGMDDIGSLFALEEQCVNSAQKAVSRSSSQESASLGLSGSYADDGDCDRPDGSSTEKMSSGSPGGKSGSKTVRSAKEIPGHRKGRTRKQGKTRQTKKTGKESVSKRVTCEECGKTYCEKASLKLHMRIHRGEMPYECDTCGRKFRQSSQLTVHKRQHSGEKPYKCSYCVAAFISCNKLRAHESKHTGKYPHECKVDGCNYGCGSRSALEKHMNKHSETRYKCPDCEKTFTFPGNVKKHWKVKHSGEKPFQCSDCSAQFPLYSYLVHHRKKKHSNVPVKKDVVCHVCAATFTNCSALNTHMRVHSDEKPFTCKFCHVSFRAPCHVHMEKCQKRMLGITVRKKEKSFVCDLCGARFTSKYTLNHHTKIHTGERVYQCDICSAQLASAAGLVMHKRIHTGEKPFGCDQCEKKFRTLPHLRNHKLSHSGEKPFQCTLCSARFARKYQVKNHMVFHTRERKYVCSFCQGTFPRPCSLKIHIRLRHTGEKPYLCTECNSSFALIRDLKKHTEREHANRSFNPTPHRWGTHVL